MPQHLNTMRAIMMIQARFAKVFEQGAHLLAAALQAGFFALPDALHLVDHQKRVAADVEAGGAGVVENTAGGGGN